MKASPQRGAGDQQIESGPRRRQPTKAQTKSTRDAADYSPTASNIQGENVVVLRRGPQPLRVGGAVLATTRPDEPERQRRQAAVASLVLAQMRRLHEMTGGPGSDLTWAEEWFEIALSQYVHLAHSGPKWTYGPMRWARKYVPALVAARSPVWFEDRIREHQQDRRFYSAAATGTKLRVMREQFLQGRLWHMWPAGMTPAERKRLSLDNKVAWAREARLLANPDTKPHDRALCNTNARLPGESKSAFYRRLARERSGS